MKKSILTQSEIAQKVMQMFPPLFEFRSNETCIFGEDGNSVLKVSEFASGKSYVRIYPFMHKSYSQLKKEDKIKVMEFINSIKVDLIEEKHKDSDFVYKLYYLTGAYKKRFQTHPKGYVEISSIKITPFNY